MLKLALKSIISITIILILTTTGISIGLTKSTDIDPLVDLKITIDILKIRSLEHEDPQLDFREVIDPNNDPDFYTKVIVNGQSFTSDIIWNKRYIYNNPFSVTVNVPDTTENVDIKIQLWDAAEEYYMTDRLCDISPDNGTDTDAFDAEIVYNLKNGHWTGDDELKDASGYGRLNGCSDGTIYKKDRDCELWFDVTFNDFDSDGIPYFIEDTVYGTNPCENDSYKDFDLDNVSTWWEFKYGYDPFTFDDHKQLDPDIDGIKNYYEFITSKWYSDPFTRDLFLELDEMEEGPNGEISIFPNRAKEMLYTVHDRQNLVYHLDDGNLGGPTGSELIPFDDLTDQSELYNIRDEFFYNTSPESWRKYVFHYGVLIWKSNVVAGNAFGRNAFQISSRLLQDIVVKKGYDRDVVFASAYMHETGHNLKFYPIPGHHYLGWLMRIFLPLYKSCMSYGMIYRMVDYSDGSRPFLGRFFGDYNDWERMDLTYFLGDESIDD